jgi:hypothetical protein
VVWYYGECVRSEEQGSNLHEYVTDAFNDAPFLNSFTEPVYFHGLPWDISFILPEGPDITVTIQFYNSSGGTVGAPLVTAVDVDLASPSLSLDGHICSLTIDQTMVPVGATYFTVEIT